MFPPFQLKIGTNLPSLHNSPFVHKMSSRIAMQTARRCAQTIRMTQRVVQAIVSPPAYSSRKPVAFDAFPKMQLQKAQMNQLTKKMSTLPKYAKMTKCEVCYFSSKINIQLRRIQVAAITMLCTSSSNVILNLAEVLTSTLCAEEDESGSSTYVILLILYPRGVRRRKGQQHLFSIHLDR